MAVYTSDAKQLNIVIQSCLKACPNPRQSRDDWHSCLPSNSVNSRLQAELCFFLLLTSFGWQPTPFLLPQRYTSIIAVFPTSCSCAPPQHDPLTYTQSRNLASGPGLDTAAGQNV